MTMVLLTFAETKVSRTEGYPEIGCEPNMTPLSSLFLKFKNMLISL
ncbi:hypothetical protein F898_01689 [Acinetobacter courvalinii]|nr:hypothetical protein F898_01689 [Acinetobacter courvalinii]